LLVTAFAVWFHRRSIKEKEMAGFIKLPKISKDPIFDINPERPILTESTDADQNRNQTPE
jgi:hypothetical protein